MLRHPRTIVQLALLLTMVVLLVVAMVTGWNSATTEVDRVAAERGGVAYLRPLTTLISELAEAESASVRGMEIQTVAINGAINAVDSADREYGQSLEVRTRWSDIRKIINETIERDQGSLEAFEQYSEVLTLIRQLIRRIADTSGLRLDPSLDTSHLARAALVELPDVIIGAGKAADLAVLDNTGGEAETTRLTRVAVARYEIAVAAETVGIGLARAQDETASRTLGTTIPAQLDAFRSAVDAFVPSGTRLRGLGPSDPASITHLAELVRQAARPLAEAVLDELDDILRQRQDSLCTRRLRTSALPGLATLLAVVVAWLLLPPPGNAAHRGRERADDAG